MYYLKASSEREDYGGLYIRLQVEDVPLHCGNSLQPGRFLSTPRQDYQDIHQKTVFASRTAFFASFPFTPIRNAKIPLDDPVPVFTNQEDESWYIQDEDIQTQLISFTEICYLLNMTDSLQLPVGIQVRKAWD